MKSSIAKKLYLLGTGLLVACVLLISGCDIMDVSNPNSLVEDDLFDPSSASGLKNGVLNALMGGTAWTYAATSTAADELYWTGSYEAYRNYDIGHLTDENNEITVNIFPELSEARWLSDYAIERLNEFDQNGTLADRSILAEVYIYSALTRITIGDSFENFVYSDRMEAAPAIGEDQMHQVYDEAIDHATQALQIAEAIGDATLQMQALGVRARARHAKGVWELLHPPGETPADPLVSGTGASADADAALDLMESDYRATFDYVASFNNNYLASQVNGRNEMTFEEPFVDLKTQEADPRVVATQEEFTDIGTYSEDYSPLTWLSAREMHLIIAEEAIGTDDDLARTELNAVRALDGLPEIEEGDDLVEALEHERRANLYLQGRRLNDMYRFGTTSPNWLPGEDAMTAPGTRLPIPSNEILANPNL